MTGVRRRYPPSARARPTPSEAEAADEVEGRRPIKRAAVLQLLREREWVTRAELEEVGGLEGAKRARELRKFGHVVTCRPIGGGVWEYRLCCWWADVKCIPCAVGKHDRCVMDRGLSVAPTLCDCADQHGGAPEPKVKIVKRRSKP